MNITTLYETTTVPKCKTLYLHRLERLLADAHPKLPNMSAEPRRGQVHRFEEAGDRIGMEIRREISWWALAREEPLRSGLGSAGKERTQVQQILLMR